MFAVKFNSMRKTCIRFNDELVHTGQVTFGRDMLVCAQLLWVHSSLQHFGVDAGSEMFCYHKIIKKTKSFLQRRLSFDSCHRIYL